MGKEYLIDSNAIIDFFNGKLPDEGRNLLFSIEQPIISIITYIEILGFSNIDKDEEGKWEEKNNITDADYEELSKTHDRMPYKKA